MPDDADPCIGLLETAWGIIANAGEGDWSREPDGWQDAAWRWYKDWRAFLGEPRTTKEANHE